ncbi:SpoIIE family protein phosphatase [Cellulomonas oligotrophica]|uniref:PAS domain-containing protein n=1 Tax=Cellulomonas oligotrophica TaxID=931536 RepID=A0A7Y9JZS6_9CELL|nr:SpoIIE family protein phosphatase [Cellulomonas oligotrophica]NYD86555.1 PAS domain-containing protein [Cellulomonas oligotrophica]GIG32555.1 hypothetical protein Col01nite_17140 [Cellulomonas oligotrophica]
MRPGRDVLTGAVVAVLYALAVWAGRDTVLAGTDTALTAPAVGVAAAWVLVRRTDRSTWPDVLVGFALTAAVTAATGTAPAVAVAIGAFHMLQAVVFAALVRPLCPATWRSRARAPLNRHDVWGFLLAGAGASLASGLAIAASRALTPAGVSWDEVTIWVSRNTMGSFTVGTLVVVMRIWWPHRHGDDEYVHRMPRRSVVEYAVVAVVSPVMYVVWFLELSWLPLVFPLIGLTIWVGVRLSLPFVVLHDSVTGAVAVVITLGGVGPFAVIEDPTVRILVAHLFTGMVALVGLALAVMQEELNASLREAEQARRDARQQAQTLTTVVDTMDEGLGVVDGEGRLLLRNARARALLGGRSDEGLLGNAALFGVHRLDGTPMPDAELPHQVTLATGQPLRDVDVVVRNADVPEGRVLRFNCTPMRPQDGGGVVSVLRDVTALHQELAIAARVQRALLPQVLPVLAGYDLASAFVPAGSVGGDFYDWQETPTGLVVTLADVMGKGAGAAILAATLRTTLHEQSASDDVAAVLARAERRLSAELQDVGAFITAVRMHLSPTTGEVSYTDAGHGLSMVVHPDGTRTRLLAGRPPLGLVPDAPYPTSRTTLARGEMLLSFSDGVLDALGGSIDELGEVAALAHDAPTSHEAVRRLLARVEGTGLQEDDVTVVAIRRDAA